MAYVEKNGITIVKHYIDRAISAKTDNRPEFQQMIKEMTEVYPLRGMYLGPVCQKTSTLPYRECRGEHCSPANLTKQRFFG